MDLATPKTTLALLKKIRIGGQLWTCFCGSHPHHDVYQSRDLARLSEHIAPEALSVAEPIFVLQQKRDRAI